MNEHPTPSIKEKVLQAIKGNRVTMRPRWHFVLGTALVVFGILIVFFLLLYFSSFAFFVLRRSGAWFAPSFGPRGWLIFLGSLPWIVLALAGLCILVLEFLMKKYAFAYRRPILYSVLALVVLAVFGGYAIERAHVQSGFIRFAEGNRVLFMRDFYRTVGMPHLRDLHRGEVRELGPANFVMQNERGETILVSFASTTLFPLGSGFATGDSVVVFGVREDGTISARGIRKIESDWFDVPLHVPMHGGMRMFPPPIFP